MTRLEDPVVGRCPATGLIDGTPVRAYVYSYPHKTAHRWLNPPIPLADAWAGQRRDALFLYFHVPFCDARCGFCNLFSLARPEANLVDAYLRQVRQQAERTRHALGDARFARLAIGGGTPTFLDVDQLGALLAIAVEMLGTRPRDIPMSVEASPATVSSEKLAMLREFGCDRLSLGVQAFDACDARTLGRAQQKDDVCRAVESVRLAGFPVLNLDLIYGVPGQGVDRWLATLAEALRAQPEELYLYPLYMRPLTPLGQRQPLSSDTRLDCYREARALLVERGYRQLSMRMFQAPTAPEENGPVYCCQKDGMVGLGCGARSYAGRLHYSTPYAVPRAAVRSLIEDFVGRSPESFDQADHGILLDAEDQRRRFVLLSLLQAEGLHRAAYLAEFAADVLEDLPQLRELEPLGLLEVGRDRLRLTASGLQRSDAIGPWLFSDRVRRLMETYTWRTA